MHCIVVFRIRRLFIANRRNHVFPDLPVFSPTSCPLVHDMFDGKQMTLSAIGERIGRFRAEAKPQCRGKHVEGPWTVAAGQPSPAHCNCSPLRSLRNVQGRPVNTLQSRRGTRHTDYCHESWPIMDAMRPHSHPHKYHASG
jgi:hypothetical protein